MAWLVRDAEVLASLELATSRRDRRRGLLGRDGIDGALLLQPARSVHTFGMRFAIDVAHCRVAGDGDDLALEVVRVTTMRPHRLGVLVPRAGAVLEAEAGSFGRWGIRPGVELAVRGT